MNLGELVFNIVVDSSDAKKNLESTQKNITSISSTAKQAGESIKKNLGGAFESLIKMALPIATVTGAVSALSKAQSDLVDVGKQSTMFGVKAADLMAWGRAAETLGFSANDAKSAIVSLQQGLQEAALTGQGKTAGMLNYLGVRMRKANGELRSGAEIMADLSKKFTGMSQEKALYLGQMLGLSPDTIALLRTGKTLTNELAEAYKHTASPEAIQRANEFDESLTRLKFSGQDLARELFVAVAPAINAILEALLPVARFLADNPFFAVASAGALAFKNSLSALLPAFKLVGSVGIGVFKALGAVISKNPIIFAITSIIAVLSDLYDWINGAPSVFGSFLNWLGIGDEALKNFKNAVAGVKRIFGIDESGDESMRNRTVANSVPQSTYNTSNAVSNRNLSMDAHNEIVVNVNGGGNVGDIRSAVASGVNDGMSQYNATIVSFETGVIAK